MPRDGRHQRTKIHTALPPGRIQWQPAIGGHWSVPSRADGHFHCSTTNRYLLLMNPPVPAGVDGKASDALLKLGRFFTRWEESDDGRVAFRKGGRAGDVFYRDRWSHDKVVRSTHGVNCTGSCSWKIYVRDGISPGKRSRLTIRPSALIDQSMNPAAARAVPPSPGTPTPLPESDIRTRAACCWRCTGKPSSD